MRFYGEKEKPVSHYPQDTEVPPQYTYDSDPSRPYDDDVEVRCPSHTTRRKLMTRIDLHVVPFLCIMYCMQLSNLTRPIYSY